MQITKIVSEGVAAGLTDQQICDRINAQNSNRWFPLSSVIRERVALREREEYKRSQRKRGEPLTEEDWQAFVDAWDENVDWADPRVPDENEPWLLEFSAARGSDPKADRMHFRNIAALDPRFSIVGLDHVSTVLSEIVWPRYAAQKGLSKVVVVP